MPTKTTTKSASSNLSKGNKPANRKAIENPMRAKRQPETSTSVAKTPAGGPIQARSDLDIEYFRGLLLTERVRLEEEREQIRSSALDVDGALPEEGEGEDDSADLASSMMDKEMNLSVEDEIEDMLSTVDRALQKIEEGTYGICDISGDTIPTSRLEIIPWAALTVECQALAEE